MPKPDSGEKMHVHKHTHWALGFEISQPFSAAGCGAAPAASCYFRFFFVFGVDLQLSLPPASPPPQSPRTVERL